MNVQIIYSAGIGGKRLKKKLLFHFIMLPKTRECRGNWDLVSLPLVLPLPLPLNIVGYWSHNREVKWLNHNKCN